MNTSQYDRVVLAITRGWASLNEAPTVYWSRKVPDSIRNAYSFRRSLVLLATDFSVEVLDRSYNPMPDIFGVRGFCIT